MRVEIEEELRVKVFTGHDNAREPKRRRNTAPTVGLEFVADGTYGLFFTGDFPPAEGILDFETCKWAYTRVSTERPDVPDCQRRGIRPTQR